MRQALLCLTAATALVPPPNRRPPTALRAKAEAFVTEQAPDLLKEIVMKRTPLGEDARRNNARTGGSVALEHVTLDKIDGNGLAFTCSVKRRAGGFGGGFSTEDETTDECGERLANRDRRGGGVQSQWESAGKEKMAVVYGENGGPTCGKKSCMGRMGV